MNLEALAPILLAYAWKGALILVVAAVAERALFRASAALRHGVWTLALAALMLLPIAATFAPAVSIPVPAAMPKAPAVKTPVIESRPEVTPEAVTPRTDQAAMPAAPITALPVEHGAAPVVTQPVEAPALSPTPQLSQFEFPSFAAMLVSLWAVGALLCLCHYVLGLALIARMRRRTAVVADDAMGTALDEARRTIGLARPVALRIGGAAVPMTWGYFRPTVLLPDTAAAWPETKLRVVLLHELAHAKRADFVTHGLARTAAALHWFNPLAWYGVHRMLRLREVACDDAVLRHGAVPAEYANHLMDVVRALRDQRPGPAAAIAMARSPRIESRLRAILNAAANRAPVSRRTVAIASAVAIAGLTLAAGLRVVEAEDRWVARLGNGEGLELVAIGDLSVEPQGWWSPDETPIPLDQVKEVGEYLASSRRIGPEDRVLLFRPQSTHRTGAQILRDFDLTFGDDFPCATRFVWNYGGYYDGCLVYLGSAEKGLARTDASLSVNKEPWQSILERDGWGGQSQTLGDGEITFMGVEAQKGGLLATVSKNAYPNVELRAILTDESGIEHTAYPGDTLGTQPRLESFQWPDLRVHDVAGFRVEMRQREGDSEEGVIRDIPIRPPADVVAAKEPIQNDGTDDAPGPDATNPAYTASFPSGTEVELVAIGDPMTDPITWWGPDGQPVEAPDADLAEVAPIWADASDDQIARVFVLRKHYGTSETDSDRTWPTGDLLGYGGRAFHPVQEDDTMADGLVAGAVVFAGTPATTDIEVRIVEGPWDVQAEIDELGGLVQGLHLIVQSSSVPETPTTQTVIVTDRLQDYVRARLLDGDGTLRKAAGHTISEGGSAGERLRTASYRFEDISRDDIQSTVIETSPYTGVIFANVPLQPGGAAATVTQWVGEYEPEPGEAAAAN